MASYSRNVKICGIYTLTNLLNGKMYVGYTTDLYNRDKKHLSDLRSNNHGNEHLQRAWNKYGESNFLFEELEECPQEFLCSQEHYWCNMLNTHNDKYGYNIKPTDPNKISGNHSKETREKISKKKIGTKRPDVTKLWTGRKHTEESKKKMSENLKGKTKGAVFSEERKSNISKGIRAYWSKQPKKVKPAKSIKTETGWKHLPESIEKISKRSQQEDNRIRIREIGKIASQNRIGTHVPKEQKLKSVKTKFGVRRVINIYLKKTMELLYTCDFSPEASLLTGVKRSCISNNLIGLSKSAGGFIFKYQEVTNE